MNREFGSVCHVEIDLDPEFNYPKGAARWTFNLNCMNNPDVLFRVSFLTYKAYIHAMRTRFVTIASEDSRKVWEFLIQTDPIHTKYARKSDLIINSYQHGFKLDFRLKSSRISLKINNAIIAMGNCAPGNLLLPSVLTLLASSTIAP